MNLTNEKKPGVIFDKKSDEPVPEEAAKGPALDKKSSRMTTTVTTENFRERLKELDTQRRDLVKDALGNNKPGRTFDASVVRKVNKVETARNRLIVAHFARLLKDSPSDVHAIVHQIIEL